MHPPPAVNEVISGVGPEHSGTAIATDDSPANIDAKKNFFINFTSSETNHKRPAVRWVDHPKLQKIRYSFMYFNGIWQYESSRIVRTSATRMT